MSYLSEALLNHAKDIAAAIRLGDLDDPERELLESDEGLASEIDVDGTLHTVRAYRYDRWVRVFGKCGVCSSDVEASEIVDRYVLVDAETGDELRPATSFEATASILAADADGGYGFVLVDGRKVYVR